VGVVGQPEELVAEVLERVEPLDLLQREDVGLQRADRRRGDRLVLHAELEEEVVVDDPPLLVGLRRVDPALEPPAGEQVLDVEGGETNARHTPTIPACRAASGGLTRVAQPRLSYVRASGLQQASPSVYGKVRSSNPLGRVGEEVRGAAT
jgi:hypothetical protein